MAEERRAEAVHRPSHPSLHDNLHDGAEGIADVRGYAVDDGKRPGRKRMTPAHEQREERAVPERGEANDTNQDIERDAAALPPAEDSRRRANQRGLGSCASALAASHRLR